MKRAGALTAGTGGVGDTAVAIAATDRHIAGGSFGVVESQALSALLQHSRNDGVPVILCLDSAGARLDEGLPALGAFRQLYRHFLDLRLAGVPTLAVLGRDCFGGASMLAAACGQRVYSPVSRLAMSGPAVIQALGGRQELDAEDAGAVTALDGRRGARAPAAGGSPVHGHAGRFSPGGAGMDGAARSGIAARLARPAQPTRHAIARARNGALAAVECRDGAAAALLKVPPGFQARTIDGVLIGRTTKTRPILFSAW